MAQDPPTLGPYKTPLPTNQGTMPIPIDTSVSTSRGGSGDTNLSMATSHPAMPVNGTDTGVVNHLKIGRAHV